MRAMRSFSRMGNRSTINREGSFGSPAAEGSKPVEPGERTAGDIAAVESLDGSTHLRIVAAYGASGGGWRAEEFIVPEQRYMVWRTSSPAKKGCCLISGAVGAERERGMAGRVPTTTARKKKHAADQRRVAGTPAAFFGCRRMVVYLVPRKVRIAVRRT